MVRHCPNPMCPDLALTGRAQEFTHVVTECTSCGSPLVDGPSSDYADPAPGFIDILGGIRSLAEGAAPNQCCEACGRMLGTYEPFCPDCNDAGEEAPADPAPTSSRLSCPRCHQAMVELAMPTTTVAECTSCAGTWVSRESLTRFARNSAVELGDFEAGPASPMRCPQCSSQPLDPVSYRDTIAEACSACGGVFLDLGELADVIGDSMPDAERSRRISAAILRAIGA